MEPKFEEILNAVKKSGYLFEQEVATIFEKLGIHVRTNSAFKDIDEDKSREIDIMGFKNYLYDEENKLYISARFICECKNNQNPFTFITRNKSKNDDRYIPPNFTFSKNKYEVPISGESNSYRAYDGFEYFKLKEIFPYSLQDYKAVQFCKIIPKGKEWIAQHDGIYDSIIYPLSKCLEYYKNLDIEQQKKISTRMFTVYFPMVVLNSNIYSINSHLDSEIVNEVDYMSFIREIENKKQKGQYLIDFVKKESLENYLTNAESFMQKFLESIKSNMF